MGIPWDEDEVGRNCNQFPLGTTPKYLWASISGVHWCWPLIGVALPNGVFKLTQSAYSACYWEFVSSWMIVAFSLAAGGCGLSAAAGSGGILLFNSLVSSPHVFSFANQIVCNIYNPPPWACGGSGIVSRRHRGTSPAVRNIAELLNIEEESESMADFYPAADPAECCLKFCRQKTPTNIQIKVDYNVFES